MFKVPDPKDLANFDIRNYEVPPLERYIDRRGFIYILYDGMFPDYIKVGRTSNVFKRLTGYNSDKPYPTAKMLYISKVFENSKETERKILDYLYSVTEPTTLSREWFEIKHKEIIIEIIEKAELTEELAQEQIPSYKSKVTKKC